MRRWLARACLAAAILGACQARDEPAPTVTVHDSIVVTAPTLEFSKGDSDASR